MILVSSWLIQQTGFKTYDESPFAINHSNDEDVIQARSGKILIYLTMSRMLLGVDIGGIDLVIIACPPDNGNAGLQAMGRAGGKDQVTAGSRRKTVTYVLLN